MNILKVIEENEKLQDGSDEDESMIYGSTAGGPTTRGEPMTRGGPEDELK